MNFDFVALPLLDDGMSGNYSTNYYACKIVNIDYTVSNKALKDYRNSLQGIVNYCEHYYT